MTTDDDLLDAGLERLATTGPEYGGGLSNHGPMAIEALHHLGRADAIAAWLDRYITALEPEPEPDGRAPKLAALDDWADWRALFERELGVRDGSRLVGDPTDWRDVVARWAPLLGPGLFAGATHGLLRTAHAIRSLRTRDTPLRRRELAAGLAYWAAVYQTLPGDVRPRGRRSAAELLASLPEIPREGWLITQAIHGLDRIPELPGLLSELDPAELELGRLIAALAPWAAAGASVSPIVHVHVLTSAVALAQLEDLLARPEFERILAHAWHAAAGLIGTWRPRGPAALSLTPVDVVDIDELTDRAVGLADEHAIKLVDACLTGHARWQVPRLLDAAARLLGALEDPPPS